MQQQLGTMQLCALTNHKTKNGMTVLAIPFGLIFKCLL